MSKKNISIAIDNNIELEELMVLFCDMADCKEHGTPFGSPGNYICGDCVFSKPDLFERWLDG